jgi:hypothetical protein
MVEKGRPQQLIDDIVITRGREDDQYPHRSRHEEYIPGGLEMLIEALRELCWPLSQKRAPIDLDIFPSKQHRDTALMPASQDAQSVEFSVLVGNRKTSTAGRSHQPPFRRQLWRIPSPNPLCRGMAARARHSIPIPMQSRWLFSKPTNQRAQNVQMTRCAFLCSNPLDSGERSSMSALP